MAASGPAGVSGERDRGVRIVADGLTRMSGRRTVVDGLDFVAEPGAVTALLGPPGSGTSTTLRMVVGLLSPHAGTVLIDGRAPRRLTERATVLGAALGPPGGHPGRRVRDHLRCYAAAAGVADGRVDQLLGLTGLAGHAGRRAGELPVPVRQRLALATALIGDPRALVLDEPMGRLDSGGVAWLRDLLHSLRRSGRTVLLAGSRLADVVGLAERVVLLDGGRRVFDGTLDELRRAGRGRVIIRVDDPVVLVQALHRGGFVDIQSSSDGLLAVDGADQRHVLAIAAAARVAVFTAEQQPAALGDVLGRLVRPPAPLRPPPAYPPPPYPPWLPRPPYPPPPYQRPPLPPGFASRPPPVRRVW